MKNIYNLCLNNFKIKTIILILVLINIKILNGGGCLSSPAKVTDYSSKVETALNYYKNTDNQSKKNIFLLALEIEKLLQNEDFYSIFLKDELNFNTVSPEKYIDIYANKIFNIPAFKNSLTLLDAKELIAKQLSVNCDYNSNVLSLVINIQKIVNSYSHENS